MLTRGWKRRRRSADGLLQRRTAASQRRLVLLADAPKMRAARGSEHQLSFTEPDGRLCDTPDTPGRHGFKKKERNKENGIKEKLPSLVWRGQQVPLCRVGMTKTCSRLEWNGTPTNDREDASAHSPLKHCTSLDVVRAVDAVDAMTERSILSCRESKVARRVPEEKWQQQTPRYATPLRGLASRVSAAAMGEEGRRGSAKPRDLPFLPPPILFFFFLFLSPKADLSTGTAKTPTHL